MKTKNLHHSTRKVILLVVLFITSLYTAKAGVQRYSVNTGNWGATTTWSATSGGSSGASVPVAGDDVFIENGKTVTVNIASACANLSIAAGSALTVGGFNFAVSGNISVSGTITHNNTGGTKTYNGDITINSGGLWNETVAEAFTLAGNLQNDGTFTSSTGTHTFSGTGKTMGGTNLISIPNVTFTGAYTNSGSLTVATLLTVTGVTFTNNGTITASTALSGTGGLTQGSNSTLNLGGTAGITTLTATAAGNEVNYTGAAQTAKVTTYVNLTLSGSGAKTFATGPTINGVLSLEGTATIVVTTGVVTYGSNATLQYNTATARTATAEEWITPFAASGGVVIANTGVITLDVAKTFNAGVPLTINSGATLNAVAFTNTFGVGSSIMIYGTWRTTNANGFIGAANTSIANSPTYTLGANSTIEYSLAGGQTVSPVSYVNLTLSGSGAKTLTGVSIVNKNFTFAGTATASAATSMTIGGSVILGSGTTFTGGAFTHIVRGDWTNNGGTFTNANSTVTFNNTTYDQNINGTATAHTFYNVTVAKGARKIVLGGGATAVTVSNALTMTSGNIDCGTVTLQLGTSTSVVGTLNYTSGNICGSFQRWFNSTAGAKIFPLGLSTASGTESAQCKAAITFTNLTNGSLTGSFVSANPGSSGLPLTESSITLINTFPDGYWSFVAGTLASTNYALELTGVDFCPYSQDAEVRILKRSTSASSWTLSGTHVAATGPPSFTAKRSGLSGFGQFAHATQFANVDAGPDQQKNSSTFTMAGVGTGTWSLIRGTASITNPGSATTTITGVPSGSYATLRWTVTSGFCTVYDEVEILNDLNRDLPSPNVHNITAPAGTWVIPMDNTLQAKPGHFNMFAYGLAVTLLNNETPLHWIIKAGKLHNGIDFTASASQIFPAIGAAASRDFKGGPLLIFPQDTAGVRAIINTFNNGTASAAKVNVYKLTSATSVDERYILGQKPKVAILNDGGKADIHAAYMVDAGIPAGNYSILTTAVNLDDECYTFASEPHSEAVSAVLDSIHAYLTRGGNFLAECLAVNTYENNTSGHFFTTNGITITNTDISPNYAYPNADLSFGQYIGQFDAMVVGGAERNWVFNSGSVFKNNGYTIMGGSGAYSNIMGQNVAKLGIGPGHMAFFTGGHDYSKETGEDFINGERSYFNAMLTPSDIAACNFLHFDQDISVTKTADKSDICLGGGNITFTVVVRNNGPSVEEATGLVLRDIFPAAGFSVSGTPYVSQGSYNQATGTWSIGTIALDEKDTLRIVATPVSAGVWTNKAYLEKYIYDVVQVNDTSSVIVTVLSLPSAPAVGTITQPTCTVSTGSVYLSGLPSSGTWTLTRSPGNITTTGSGSSITISGLTSGTYSYTVTNANGCTSTASANITINTQPVTPSAPIVGTITQPTCTVSTGSVYLSGLPSSGTWTLTRSPGNITTTGSGSSITISGLTSGTYSYTVTNANGCTSTASANITINTQPVSPSAPTVGTITQPTCTVSTGSVYLSGLPSSGTWTLTRSPGNITTTGSGS
ncbi:MAG: hypothetical protein WCI92_04300, partial [Bacteroidota bacterium]